MHFARTEAWNGLSAGDPVRIAGLRGRRWRFRCHVVNLATGATWVEVAELDVARGAAGASRAAGADMAHRQLPVRRIRSFAEDRVVPLPSARRTRGARAVGSGQGTLDLGLPDPPEPPAPPRRPRPSRNEVATAAGSEALRFDLWADGSHLEAAQPGSAAR